MRDFLQGSYTNSINGTTTKNVFYSTSCPSIWVRLDKQEIVLPAEFLTQRLVRVLFSDFGGAGFQYLLVHGITVESACASVSQQPASRSSCPTGIATLSVVAGGVGPFTYQWQYESDINSWTDALDGVVPYAGGTITASNVETDHLQLALNTTHGAPPIRFRCVVTNSCGSVTSDPATLVPCQSDLTCDNVVDDDDFVVFVAAYNLLDCADPAMAADCPADLNGDAFVDDSDFVLFVGSYNELGCI
ncbi:MAG: hypothetical protein JNM86_09280 [Phycisphaerae bacterium]|nr:hypothetical protein [Phycisphaerae bacterium]